MKFNNITETLKQKEVLALVLILLSFLIYIPSLKAPFFWDDTDMIPGLEQKEADIGYNESRPLRKATIYLDSFLWGTNPAGYHFTNIILNIIAVLLTFYFLSYALNDRILSFLVSLAFLVHPLHVETVVWIKNRAELLFYICSILTIILYEKKRILSVIFFAFAIFSKETAVIIPVGLTVYYFLENRKKKIKSLSILWAIVLVRIITGSMGLTEYDAENVMLDFPNNIVAVVKTFAFYFYMLLFPKDLNIEWRLDLMGDILSPVNILSLVFITVITAYIIKQNKKRIKYYYLFLVISILPFSNIIFLINRPWAEQRMYLPVLFYSLIIVELLYMKKNKVTKIALSLLLLLLAGRSFARVIKWQNPKDLWKDAYKEGLEDDRVEVNLANSYYEQGEYDKAILFYKKALNSPRGASVVALNNLGLSYMKRGQYEESAESFKALLKNEPEHIESHYNLGILYLKTKQYNLAIDILLKAKEIMPTEPQIFNNLAVAYKRAGNIEKAVDSLREVLNLRPEYDNARYNLAVILTEAKRKDEALKEILLLLEKDKLNPKYLELYQEIKSG